MTREPMFLSVEEIEEIHRDAIAEKRLNKFGLAALLRRLFPS